MIRIATTSDSRAIVQLWSELADYHIALDARMPKPAPDGMSRYEMRIVSAIQDTQSQVLVAEHDSKVIGYVIGAIIELLPDMFVSEQGGFLADIYIHPMYRRHGYGRALVESLRDWFMARDILQFEWHVASKNHAAIAFWRAMGGDDVILRMRAATHSTRKDSIKDNFLSDE